MLSTKNLVCSMNDIPTTWVFEYYLKLPQKLAGQDVRTISVFNPAEKVPSLFVYYTRPYNGYKFKDFSTGKQGDGVELVQALFNLSSRYEAVVKILNDYTAYLASGKKRDHEPLIYREKYKVKAFKKRNWNAEDAAYWMSYHINSILLKEYCVEPLEYFVLARPSVEERVIVKHTKIYGYFKKDGTLYKIYQPTQLNSKFILVSKHIQGIEQLQYKAPYLAILSSLKDIMAFRTLKISNVELIAPNSENTLLLPDIIADLKQKYSGICTLLDNDKAGITAMQRYQDEYNIPMAHYKVEKDVADSVKTHNPDNTRELIIPVLRKALRRNQDA